MLKAIAEKIFHRQPAMEDLEKIREIAERAQRFEQAVIESMRETFDDAEVLSQEVLSQDISES